MREAEVQAWFLESLAPELARLSPLDRHVLGEDFARRGDLTVFCPLAIRPNLRKRVPFVVELRNLTYEQQRQVLFFILERLPRFTGAAFDATANGGYLAEQAASSLALLLSIRSA
jgi:phage FluMu gp28-like protein